MLRRNLLVLAFAAMALMMSPSIAQAELCSQCLAAQNDLDNCYWDLDIVEDEIADLEDQYDIAQATVISYLQVPVHERDQAWLDGYNDAIDALGSVASALAIAEAERDEINEEISDLLLQMSNCPICNP